MPITTIPLRPFAHWHGISITAGSLVIVVLLVVAVGVGSAVSITALSMPETVRSGEQVSATFQVGTLYQEPSVEAWTLQGETALDSPAWTVILVDQAGNQVGQQSYAGEAFAHPIDIESDAAVVEVRLAGTMPGGSARESSVVLASFFQAQEGGGSSALGTWALAYPTEQSSPSSTTPSPVSIASNTPASKTTRNTPSGTDGTDAMSDRGFFTNDASGEPLWTGVSGPQITVLGFVLSIVGIVLQLVRGG